MDTERFKHRGLESQINEVSIAFFIAIYKATVELDALDGWYRLKCEGQEARGNYG